MAFIIRIQKVENMWYGNNEYVVNWKNDGYDIKII